MSCSSFRRLAVLGGVIAAFLAITVISAPDAEARAFKLKREKIHSDGTITAWSQDGDKGVRTPVRRDKFGALEVYVPNWGWEPCGPTCAHTVQKYSFDFWEAQTENGLPVGYLSLDLFR